MKSRILVEIEGNQVVAITRPKEDIIRFLNEYFGIELPNLPLKVEVSISRNNPKPDISPDKFNGSGLPKLDAVEEYIESRSGHSHDHGIVSEYFLGYALKSNSKDKEERRKYNILSKRIKRARQRIAKKNLNGKWIKSKEGWGNPVLHTFVIR